MWLIIGICGSNKYNLPTDIDICNLALGASHQSTLSLEMSMHKNVSLATKNKSYVYCLYIMSQTHSCSLTKTSNGVKDMEINQSKKRTSSHARLTIVNKSTTRKGPPQRILHPFDFGFKAMNALNQITGVEKEPHASVSELTKMNMYERKMLECQNTIEPISMCDSRDVAKQEG